MIRSLDEMRTFKNAESRLLESLETLPGDHMLTTVLEQLRSRHRKHIEGHPYTPIGEGQRADLMIFDELYTFPAPIPLPDLPSDQPFNYETD